MEATEQSEHLLLDIMWSLSPDFIDGVTEFDKLPFVVKRFVLNDWVNTKDPVKGEGLVSHYNWLKLLEQESEIEDANPVVPGIRLNGEVVRRNDW